MRSLLLCTALLVLSATPAGTGALPEQAAVSAQETAGEELEEFVPSEEIRADSAVSFPVDI